MRGARLGQHFLKHSWAARSLAHAAAVRQGETILEIGPGKGVLTRELLTLGPVVAVEKDEKLVALLHETFAKEIADGKLRIVSDDVRNISPESLGLKEYVLAANIPYYITGEIIRQFLTAPIQPRAMALLIQKEVAQRIVSARGSILSISVKAYGTPRIVEKVSKIHFSPPPSVDSAILSIDAISKTFFEDVDEERFFAVVKAGFASKRKFVSNNLSVVFDKNEVTRALELSHVEEKARAEDLTLEQWKTISQTLSARADHGHVAS
jgi:16S rRNA (adenine1518-N6/adenine1519-N6)-dimethyltransferase